MFSKPYMNLTPAQDSAVAPAERHSAGAMASDLHHAGRRAPNDLDQPPMPLGATRIAHMISGTTPTTTPP